MERFGFQRVNTADKNKPKPFDSKPETKPPITNNKESKAGQVKQAPKSNSSKSNDQRSKDLSIKSKENLLKKDVQVRYLEKQIEIERQTKKDMNKTASNQIEKVKLEKNASKLVDKVIESISKEANKSKGGQKGNQSLKKDTSANKSGVKKGKDGNEAKNNVKEMTQPSQQGIDEDIWKDTLNNQKDQDLLLYNYNYDEVQQPNTQNKEPIKQSRGLSEITPNKGKGNTQPQYHKQAMDELEVEKKIDRIQSRINPLVDKLNNAESNRRGFTPHLLAKSVNKLVRLQAEQLTELLIDDVLLDAIAVLNRMDLQQKQKKEENKNQMAINDYIEAIKDFAMTQDQIEARFNHTQQEFRKTQVAPEEDKYLPIMQMEKDLNYFKNPEDRVRSIEISSGFIMRILDERKKRMAYVRKKGAYAPKNLEAINQLVYNIEDQVMVMACDKLDKYTGQMAQQIFENEFR